MSPFVVRVPLVNQGLTIIPDRDRRDVNQPDVLKPSFIHGILGTDDRTGNPVGPGEIFSGFRPPHTGLGGEDVRAVLESQIDKLVLLDRGYEGGKRKLSKGLGGSRGFRDADLVPQVGQCCDIILLSGFHELTRRLVFHSGQDHICGQNLRRLEAPLQSLQQAVVEVGELGGDSQPLATIGGGFKETIGLNQGEKLSLHHSPVLLIEGCLGNVVAMRGLMSELHGLPQ